MRGLLWLLLLVLAIQCQGQAANPDWTKAGDLLLPWSDVLAIVQENSIARYQIKVPDSSDCLQLSIKDVNPRIITAPCSSKELAQVFFLTKNKHLYVVAPTTQNKFHVYMTSHDKLFSASLIRSEYQNSHYCEYTFDKDSKQPQVVWDNCLWLLSEIQIPSKPGCRLSLEGSPTVDCSARSLRNSVRFLHRYNSPVEKTTEGVLAPFSSSSRVFAMDSTNQAFTYISPMQGDLAGQGEQYSYVVQGRFPGSYNMPGNPGQFWSVPYHKSGYITQIDNNNKLWCWGFKNNKLTAFSMPRQSTYLITQDLTSPSNEAPNCAIFSVKPYGGKVGEDKCWSINDDGQAVFVKDQDGSVCDRFIFDPYMTPLDQLVSAQLRQQQPGAPLDQILQALRNMGAYETRIQLEANEQAYCLAFGPTEDDSTPHLYRARCALERQQIFHRTDKYLFVVLPIPGSTNYEMIRLKKEVTKDDDINIKSFLIPESMNVYDRSNDQCSWSAPDNFGALTLNCAPTFIRLTRPSPNRNPPTCRAVMEGPLECRQSSSGLQDVFYIEQTHSCDAAQNCEVTLARAQDQKRIFQDTAIANDGSNLLTNNNQNNNPLARARWTIAMGRTGPITHVDKYGNSFCWIVNNNNGRIGSWVTRAANRQNYAQQYVMGNNRVVKSTSECTQFQITTVGPSEVNLPNVGFCVKTVGTSAFLVRNSNQGKDCDSVRFVALADEMMVGSIVAYPSGLCLTYRPSATPKTSVLSLQPCSSPTSQTFMYGRFSGRLRAVTTPVNMAAFSGSVAARRAEITRIMADPTSNPIVFFWWRSSIRAYTSIPSEFETSSEHYAWDLNIQGDVAPILSKDVRGYSGACMAYASGTANTQVVGSQQCGLFQFKPANPPPKPPLSGSVRIKVMVGGQTKCLIPNLQAFDCTSFSLPVVSNTMHELLEHFILISASSLPCNGGACDNMQVKIANGFSAEDGVMWPNPDIYAPRRVIQYGTWSDANPYWTVGFRKWGPIRGAPMTSSASGCWVYNGGLYFSTTETCTNFFIEPLYEATDLPRSVVPIFGFHESYSNTIDARGRQILFNYGVAPLKSFEFRGSSFFVNADTIQVNPSGGSRTALLLPFSVPRQSARGGLLLPWTETNAFAQPPTFGLINVRYTSYITAPPAGKSYLLMSFLKHSGCLVYVTSGNQFGIECYNNGRKISSCLSQPIQGRYGSSNPFKAQSVWDRLLLDVIVSFLYSTQAGTDSVLYVAGYPVMTCPTIESWSPPSIEYIRLFDDDSQWRYDPLPAYIRHASYYEGPNFNDLATVVQKLRDPNIQFKFQSLLTGSTTWSQCVPTVSGGQVQSLRCTINLSGGATVGALALACSRPGCSIQLISQSPPVVEYRPNYPQKFVSENAGSSVALGDVAYLTDGFSIQRFQADMTFTGTASYLEVEEKSTETETGMVELRDSFSYKLVQAYCCIRPVYDFVIDEAIF